MTDPLKTLDTAAPLPSPPPSISKKTYPIAGILTTVYGLDELPPQTTEIACLWLLHPRLATQERMSGIAQSVITDWNRRIRDGAQQPAKGLIAVAFDQRNHGTRLVDALGNEAWKQGNPRHAQDMFSVFRKWPGTLAEGTARDVSLLIDYLQSFVFPKADRQVVEHLVLGVSLGGHAAWSCLLHEPRISAGVVIIGCPDYVNVMADRARLSKLPSWTGSDPAGAQFLGSEAFPASLLDTVSRYDPASLFLGQTAVQSTAAVAGPLREGPLPEPSEAEKQRLRPLLNRTLAGKRVLNLAGGRDKLVPYHRGEVFLDWLKKAIWQDGWFADGAVTFEDVIDQSAGHEVTPGMVDVAVRFIGEALAAGAGNSKGSVRESKI